jgi:hypothetical protein
MGERVEEPLVSEALKAATDGPLMTCTCACTWTQPAQSLFPTLCDLCDLLFKFLFEPSVKS